MTKRIEHVSATAPMSEPSGRRRAGTDDDRAAVAIPPDGLNKRDAQIGARAHDLEHLDHLKRAGRAQRVSDRTLDGGNSGQSAVVQHARERTRVPCVTFCLRPSARGDEVNLPLAYICI